MTQRINRRNVIRGIGAAGIAGLAGCTGDGGGGDGDGGEDTTTESDMGGGEDTTTESDSGGDGADMSRTIMQGVLLPTTGDLADLGGPIRDGAVLPQIVLEGETDFELDFQVEDTQTDPNAAQSAAQSLRAGGYPAVTGAASSEVTISVAENVFIPSGMVGCSPASTSPAITDLEDNDLIYRTPPTDALQGEVLAQVAQERLDASNAATMYVNNSYGQLLSESFVTAFEEIGGSVGSQVSFQKARSSYTSRLESALADDPGVVVVIGYPESGKQLFRDFYSNFDASTPILVTDGLRSSSLPSDIGNPMDNVTGTAPLAAGPGREFFDEQYQAEYGEEPGVFTSQAFDATAVCLLANAAAGENDGAAIAEQMRAVANPGGEEVTPSTLADGLAMAAEGTEIQYKGASSAVDFDENGDLTAATYEYFGFQEGGGIETIDEIQFSA
ncbi:ABC transporter substrate-binding protein [Halobacterium rubrum]|uniref:ABC transporter substrate-binding protein n=1 Tax=Halobacterium TaxID=2239 RepID=UPI001F2EAFA7|nr:MULTISPECIES: ABC transporter substrate-binding protein [Halobacterium]MDH5020755.1 ABC transporter substrate-binding protein [Halobacterium rubrum]